MLNFMILMSSLKLVIEVLRDLIGELVKDQVEEEVVERLPRFLV